MKAFIASLILMAGISVIAALALESMSETSADKFSTNSVRLN